MLTQAHGELGDRELQAQNEQQQHDPDGRPSLQEGTGGRDGGHTTFTEEQANEQVERHGGQRQPSGQSAENAQQGEDDAQLEQESRRDVHGQPWTIRSTAVMPS